MREIKFRAWDTENKEFIYEAQATYDNACTGLGSLHHESFQEVLEDDSLIVEQYTGLKDKNGKEIYEGDIIQEKWFDEDVRRGENRVGKVEYFTDGFVCWFVGGRFIPLGMFPVSHIEVIGNIHENAELLG